MISGTDTMKSFDEGIDSIQRELKDILHACKYLHSLDDVTQFGAHMGDISRSVGNIESGIEDLKSHYQRAIDRLNEFNQTITSLNFQPAIPKLPVEVGDIAKLPYTEVIIIEITPHHDDYGGIYYEVFGIGLNAKEGSDSIHDTRYPNDIRKSKNQLRISEMLTHWNQKVREIGLRKELEERIEKKDK